VENQIMTPGGWAVMIVSVGTVLVLVTYCFVRVMSLPPLDMEEIKGPLDIDTRDREDAD
jgi:hypothetical protein